MSDPRLRFRIWIDATLWLEHWLDTSNPDAEQIVDDMRAQHEQIANQADERGSAWLIEVYDPDQPEEHAYVRFGTDRRGMVDPKEQP